MTRLTVFTVLVTMLTGCQAGPTAPTAAPAASEPPATSAPPRAPNPLVGAEGSYTLTLTADRSCDRLPTSVRSRRYEATITHEGGQGFSVELGGADFYPAYGSFSVFARTPLIADFYVYSLEASKRLEDLPIFERLVSAGYVAINGVASVVFDGSTLAGSVPFGGRFTYCPKGTDGEGLLPPSCDEPVDCRSTNHTLVLASR